MVRTVLWLLLIIPIGCTVHVSDPAASPDHPANPHAAQAPAPVRSTVLKIDDSANPTTRPSGAGGER